MNKIIQAMRDGMVSKLIIAGGSTAVPPNSYLDVDIDLSTSRLLVKSIEVTCQTNTAFRVEFFEKSIRDNSRYNSGNCLSEVYDVLDLPYTDLQNTDKMYFRIHNLSDGESSYDIEVRGLKLK